MDPERAQDRTSLQHGRVGRCVDEMDLYESGASQHCSTDHVRAADGAEKEVRGDRQSRVCIAGGSATKLPRVGRTVSHRR